MIGVPCADNVPSRLIRVAEQEVARDDVIARFQ